MDAVNALYADGAGDVAEAIVASLSKQVFDAGPPEPASRIRRRLAGAVIRILKRTTRTRVKTDAEGREVVAYRNPILEWSGHPYALTLLEPSCAESASFVEGGDPMNAPYMMISPEIRQNALAWDRIFLDSVLAKDVQVRFVWETRITYDIAKRRLKKGKPVRLKAAAAGTGLSMILVYDRLVREGHDPGLITATITDRAAANVTKTRRLLGMLSSTRDNLAGAENRSGISARIEDLLHEVPSPVVEGSGSPGAAELPHVVTLVGILEYFHGFTCSTTEEHLGHPTSGEDADAVDLIRRIAAMTAESGVLIANSYRPVTGARILEVVGKRFRYRNRENLDALVKTAGFAPIDASGAGHIYDVVAFEKQAAPGEAQSTLKRDTGR